MSTIPLYTYNPKKFRFVQAVVGTQVWRGGGSGKVSEHAWANCFIGLYALFTIYL